MYSIINMEGNIIRGDKDKRMIEGSFNCLINSSKQDNGDKINIHCRQF
jgi:hypothetical protein